MRSNLLILAILPTTLLAATASLRSLDHFSFRFERNIGQAGSEVKYLVRAQGYTLLLSEGGLRFHFPDRSSTPAIEFVGASAHPSLDAIDPIATRVNDYTGPRTSWVTGAPCWSRVRYHNLYPGVDLMFYGQGGHLEYDVRVAPGADPARMEFALDSSMKPNINASGDLQLAVSSGALIWHKPVAYQLIADRREPVDASFALARNRVSFRVSSFDRRYPLIIDPSLGFATYFGGTGSDSARGIAVDSAGNILIAGGTTSGNLPGLSAASFQVDYKGLADNSPQDPGDAFIAKMNAAGSALAWVTYLGGTSNDSATSIAVDSSGNAYVTGFTDSVDFPIYPSKSSVVQGNFGGGGGNNSFHMLGDAFVAKFDPTGKLLWSTYLGGSQDDGGDAIAVDSSGDVYITGATVSTNFPGVSGGFQKTFGGLGGQPTIPESGYVSFDTGDAFVAEIDPTGAHLLAATYLGGSLDDFALALTIDSSGNIWVGGGTISSNFPLAGAFQRTYGGGTNFNAQPIFSTGDGFISELSSDLKTLKYSTYFGGNQDDAVSAIAVDSSGAIYIAGATQSSNFPGASNSYHGPSIASPLNTPYIIGDAFVAKLEPGGSKLGFSFYLGGSGEDGAMGLAVDAQGNVNVVGATNSTDFCTPTSDAVSSKLNGGGSTAPPTGSLLNVGDGFIARFSNSGTMTYCSFIGGAGYDALSGLALDSSGNIYVTGVTSSSNFPTTSGVVQTANAGPPDAVVLKLTVSSGPAIASVVGAGLSTPSVKNISANGLFTIFGSGLTPAGVSQGITAADIVNNALPTNLANTCVQGGTTRWGLFYVSPTQINALAGPLPSSGTVPISVITNCGTANEITTPALNVTVAVAAPEFLYFISNGNGQNPVAAIEAKSGAYIGAPGLIAGASFSPAHAGDTLTAFGVGWGPTSSTEPIGTVASAAAGVTGSHTLTLGGAAAQVLYAGLTPTFAGLYQVNFTVPSGLSAGNQPLALDVNGVTTAAGAYITVAQ
jgi:uncharacterized protein (TIGR03437 family)